MLEKLESLYQTSLQGLETAVSTADLETWFRDTLGRKGSRHPDDPADRGAGAGGTTGVRPADQRGQKRAAGSVRSAA
jgi:hypothetical protein